MANGFTSVAVGNTPHTVDPISRIEGHLGVKVHVDGSGIIKEADAYGNLWRGFENFLIGREPNDAITFVQRICGVCPVPHGMTSNYAVESVMGINDCFQTFMQVGGTGKGVPPRAVHVRNLVLGAEFLMSSITHFYHLAAPSYVQGPAIPPWTPYFNNLDYHAKLLSNSRALPENGSGSAYSKDLWSAVIKQYVKALRIRRLTFEAGALFAGRMPMTSCYVSGGVTNDNAESAATFNAKITTFFNLMGEVGEFILTEYVPVVLALGKLYPAFDNTNNTGGLGYGAGCGNFLSWGGFPQGNYAAGETGGAASSLFMKRGYKTAAGSVQLGMSKTDVETNLKEVITRSHYADTAAEYTAGAAYPGDVSRTEPSRTDGYSWMKAPRWNSNPMEVGPLARMIINGKYTIPAGGTQIATLSWGTAYFGGTIASPTAFNGTMTSLDHALYVSDCKGIKPALVNPDLAVACVRDGLATLTFVYDFNGAVVDGVTTPVGDTLWVAKIGVTTGTATTAATETGGNSGVYVNAAALDDATINAAYGLNTAVITGIIGDWIFNLKTGLSTMDRVRARALESLWLIQAMIGVYTGAGTHGFGAAAGGWLGELATLQGAATWRAPSHPMVETQGFGATEAPRGALMHQITTLKGKISKYQCIVPTTWNGSPKDAAEGSSPKRGPMEAAMVDTAFANREATYTAVGTGSGTAVSGVEPLRVAQSFDPCIACAVH